MTNIYILIKLISKLTVKLISLCKILVLIWLIIFKNLYIYYRNKKNAGYIQEVEI